MRIVRSGVSVLSTSCCSCEPKKKSFCTHFSVNVTGVATSLLLFLIRCNGAARTLAPCVQHPGPTLPHSASRCVLPIPVSTATGAVRSPAAPAAPASAPESPAAATPSAGSRPAADAQSRARSGHAAPRRSQRSGDSANHAVRKTDAPSSQIISASIGLSSPTAPVLPSFSLRC